MLKAPPDRQKEGVLRFLAAALLGDQVLADHVGDGVAIRSIMGFSPFADDPDTAQVAGRVLTDRLAVPMQDLPVLAIWRTGGTWKRIKGDRYGSDAPWACAYLLRMPTGGQAALPPHDWANRVAWLVWRRIASHLHLGTVDISGETFDLLSEAKLYGIEMGKMEIKHVPDHNLYGFACEILVTEPAVSYEPLPLSPLLTVDCKYYEGIAGITRDATGAPNEPIDLQSTLDSTDMGY